MATRWTPDTCGCIIEYDAKFTVSQIIQKCPKHATTPNDATHFSVVLAHNRKKNAVLAAVIARITATAATGDLSGLAVTVSYDDVDRLIVTGSGLSVADQADLSNMLGTTLRFVE